MVDLQRHTEEDENAQRYEAVKAELGLTDEDVRFVMRTRTRVGNAAMRVLGRGEERKMAFLVDSLRRQDGEKIRAAKKKVNEWEKAWFKTMSPNRMFLDGNDPTEKLVKGAYRGIERDCGDDLKKWELAGNYAVSKQDEVLKRSSWSLNKEYGSIVYLETFLKNLYGGADWQSKMVEERIASEPAKRDSIIGNAISLVEAKWINPNDERFFKAFLDLAVKNTGALNSLLEAQECYGGDFSKFEIFLDLAQKGKWEAIKVLIKIRDFYGADNARLILFKEFVDQHDRPSHLLEIGDYLAKCPSLFQDNIEVVGMMLERIKGWWPCREFGDFLEVLARARAAFGNDMKRFKVAVDLSRGENLDKNVKALIAAMPVYGEDEERFAAIARLIKEDDFSRSGYLACEGVVEAKGLCTTADRFHTVVALASTWRLDVFVELLAVYGDENFKRFSRMMLSRMDGSEAGRVLMSGEAIYRANPQRLDVLFDLVTEHKKDALPFLVATQDFFLNDDEKFQEYVEYAKKEKNLPRDLSAAKLVWIGKEGRFKSCLAIHEGSAVGGSRLTNLGDAIDGYKDNDGLFEVFVELVQDEKTNSVKQLNTFVKAKEVYGENVERLRVVVKYFEQEDVYNKIVLNKYVDIALEEGEVRAGEFLLGLRKKAKGLMGPGIPEACRAMPEYEYLVAHSYPEGNYSNYEKNLACGDKREHLAKYEYREAGYPMVMSGLLGYGVTEGAEENLEVLESYSGRLKRMREFVASRGPDNEALQDAFDKKVDAMFEKLALTEFKVLTGLSVREKMLCVFISEILRRHKSVAEREKPPRSEVLDLIVEYKYAYNEDLENYIHRSADGVKIYKDTVSQHYMLLSELSVIYGENLKHVLRHDIFESLSESENYPKILDAYIANLGEEKEVDLTSKQWQRVDNTINNPHIKEEGEVVEGRYKPGRWEVFSKQIFDVFSSNIKFDTEEDRGEFTEKINEAISGLKGRLSVEGLKGLLPKLFSIRNAYAFKINAKLSEFFQHDINNIFRELAKYEEIVEEESKEKKIGGPKDSEVKKSVKKRNIRGYINKTAETANARMGAYLCIAGDGKMWQNPNYFELVLEDEDTHKCVGVVMLLNIEAEDGKKYLWFGPNPFESFLEQVSSKKCYEFMYKTVCEFAEENDFDGVVVPPKDEQILGQCTNRGGDFPGLIQASRLRDTRENLKIVKFGKKHMLGGTYGYEEGALVWEKSKKGV